MIYHLIYQSKEQLIVYDMCNNMSLHGLIVVLYVIRVYKSIYSKYMQTLLI